MMGDAQMEETRAVAAGPTLRRRPFDRQVRSGMAVGSTADAHQPGDLVPVRSYRSAGTFKSLGRRLLVELLTWGYTLVSRLVDFARRYQGRWVLVNWGDLHSWTALSGYAMYYEGNMAVGKGQLSRRQEKAVENRDPQSGDSFEAISREIRFKADAADLVEGVEYYAATSTVDAWVERMSLPQRVFKALDAYVEALTESGTSLGLEDTRAAWLAVAIDNWHNSLSHGDEPNVYWQDGIDVSLRATYTNAKRSLVEARQDPAWDAERLARSFRLQKENARAEWMDALFSGPAADPSGMDAPLMVRDALDGYFAEVERELGGLEDDPYTFVPFYPGLQLVFETVLRASISQFNPEMPDPAQWRRGLPAPVKAALDALRE
jgi:hypothetical protein